MATFKYPRKQWVAKIIKFSFLAILTIDATGVNFCMNIIQVTSVGTVMQSFYEPVPRFTRVSDITKPITNLLVTV